MAKTGEGRVALLSGEAGIGKSRLSAGFAEHLQAEAHRYVQYFCSPHHQESALFPFISEIERAAVFARDDPLDTKLDKLESLGYLASRWEDARVARRDKRPPRRYFDLTAAGAAALAEALKRYKNLKPVSLSAWKIRPSEA